MDDEGNSGDADGDETRVTHKQCHAVDVIVAHLDREPDAIAQHYGHQRHLRADGQPPIELCMVASIDGSIAVAGRSGPLSGPDDRAVLATLRRTAGLVLVGAGTVRDEGYTPPRDDGPLLAVVTARGGLDWDGPFARSPRVVIVTHQSLDVPAGIAAIRVGADSVDLTAALDELAPLVPKGGFIHAEGGPQLNGALAAQGHIDAVNLTLAGMIVGGDAGRLVSGVDNVDLRLRLAHLLVGRDHLFTRWERSDAP